MYLSCLKPISFKDHFIHNISLQALIVVINSTSIVDNTTHFCSLDYQDIAPQTKVIINLEVDLLVSKSPTISVSV